MATEQPAVKNPQEARQAQHVGLRYVLIGGLILVVIAFSAVAFFVK